MRRIFLLPPTFLLLLMFGACSSSKTGQKEKTADQKEIIKDSVLMPNLILPDLVEKTQAVFLSQIAAKITYVPLETPPGFMIGEKTVQVKPCGDYLFVSEHGKPVGVFDRSGKFIRKIGNIGRGPGEYNFDFMFWPDEFTKQVLVCNADAGTIMAFSFEGKYLRDIKPESRPMSFVPLGNSQFLSWTFMQKELEGKYYRMVFHDSTGKTTNYVFEPKRKYDFSHGVGIMLPMLFRAPEGWLYNSWENDTLFRIKADGSFQPALSWVMGGLRMPFDPLQDYARYLREKDNYLIDFSGFESPSQWLFSYEYKGRHNLAWYEKRSAEFLVVANPDTAQRGVRNDIDGGPSFFPSWDNENGRIFVRLINAIDLLDDQKGMMKNDIPPKDQEAAKKFREMVAGLNENSNPVVMLVELK